ncbi:MAG: hypothetical protein CL816_06885, partial [Coxiellaceae bacterium]|nr:hypothetical protein [Coxiellaceae bacterium]
MKRILTISITLLTALFWAPSYALSITYEIHGLKEGPDYENVTAVLKNLKAKFHDDTNIQNTQLMIKRTNEQINAALKPYGYFEAKTDTRLTTVEDGVHLRIKISPGPAIQVSAVDIQIRGDAKHDPEFEQLIRKLSPKVNHQLNTTDYDNLKKQLYNLSAMRGYFEASMTKSKIIINQPQHQASIIIHFNSGQRYRFNNITINENHYNPKFIKKFILIKPNQYFNSKLIEHSKKNLINTNAFQNVIVATQKKDKQTKTVDATITLKEKKPVQYILGAGYGTDTGVRGTLGANFRRINSNGHQLESLIQASQYNSSITATYKIPGNHPASQENLFGVAFGHIEQDTGTSDVQKVSYSYVTKKRQWHRIISLSALDEDYNITDIPKTDARMIFPSINWSRRKANSTLNPTHGLSTTINASGTPSFLSSKDTGFSQIRIDTNFLDSFSDNTFRILLRNSIGRTEIENLSELPLSLQLFAGGSRSIRGYGYNSIGPGDNLVTGTVEFQKALPHLNSW